MPYTPPGSDGLNVPSPEKGKSYRWLADDRDRMQMHLLSHGGYPGWKLVRGKNVVETRAKAQKLGLPDVYVDDITNMIKYGRLVLAEIPTAEFKRRRAERKAESLAASKAEDEAAMERMAQRGVRPMIKELAEWEDRKEFSKEDKPTVSLAGLDVPSQ